jgi:hypothetical protein
MGDVQEYLLLKRSFYSVSIQDIIAEAGANLHNWLSHFQMVSLMWNII